ncbi:hypothetical protein AXF42_Ash013771 [Apostasia shenzhenica]|uniref:DUF7356 domain-containing protein n=1 Tax=Apostasia shenzhenica TaxID=1088818 RepID=A0A2I0A4S9_9ASPA|nr:hypothetical protein AXF42_Ash013771 [Apostasia shenzhenica]
MGNCNQTVPVALLCVLAMAMVSSASSMMNFRILVAEEKGDGKPSELPKVSPSTPPTSPLNGNASASSQSQPPPPKPDSSPPNSLSSDSPRPKSPSWSTPSGPEDKNLNESSQGTPNSPPKKEAQKAPESPNKGDDAIIQPPVKQNLNVPQAPVNDKTPPAQVKDEASQPTKEDNSTTLSGKSDDSSKKENCDISDASTVKCQNGALVACLLQAETNSKDLFLLVQNIGADDLKVNVTFPVNLKIGSKMLELSKHGVGKVEIEADNSQNLEIVLNAGKEDCILRTKQSISDWLSFQQMPAYAAQVGAYFLFATILFIGGTWACCKFGKREKRVDAGIPYQQLEMTTQAQSISVASNEISADNWDQSWDDDWDDEEAAVRTSGKRHTEIASSNGISSRSPNPNKDGWDIDWDD